jgi:hypothetical protein
VENLSDEQEHVRFSRVGASAVAAAMRVALAEMPEASEKRRLLLVLTNAAASCGILRIEVDDVMSLVAGAYKQGSQLPAPPAGAALFE